MARRLVGMMHIYLMDQQLSPLPLVCKYLPFNYVFFLFLRTIFGFCRFYYFEQNIFVFNRLFSDDKYLVLVKFHMKSVQLMKAISTLLLFYNVKLRQAHRTPTISARQAFKTFLSHLIQ